MPEYEYEVVDRGGRVVTGQAEADSVTELVRRLGAEGNTVVEVSERRVSARSRAGRRLRLPELVVAFHELATLLESGVPLGDAVLAQGRGSYHPALAGAFQSIAQALVRGENFSGALRTCGLALPEYVYHLVEAGEHVRGGAGGGDRGRSDRGCRRRRCGPRAGVAHVAAPAQHHRTPSGGDGGWRALRTGR